MAAPYNPPKKNEDFIFYCGLRNASDGRSFQSTPTIAAGDFKVSIDGGSLTNLGTLPAVTPGSSVMLKVTLSSSEMNGDSITVVGIDQTNPKEWCDFMLNIPTTQ